MRRSIRLYFNSIALSEQRFSMEKELMVIWVPGWFTQPQQPKGGKDKVKRPEGLQLDVEDRRVPRLLVNLYQSI